MQKLVYLPPIPGMRNIDFAIVVCTIRSGIFCIDLLISILNGSVSIILPFVSKWIVSSVSLSHFAVILESVSESTGRHLLQINFELALVDSALCYGMHQSCSCFFS